MALENHKDDRFRKIYFYGMSLPVLLGIVMFMLSVAM